MVHTCAINGCLSGGRKLRRKNLKLNKRNPSLFTVPKCPDLLRKWSTELQQELSSKNFVCELHFNEGDVIKTDKIKLPDGKDFISERERYSLRLNAIPTLSPKSVDDNSQFVINNDKPQSACTQTKSVTEESTGKECYLQDIDLVIKTEENSNDTNETKEQLHLLPLPEPVIEQFSTATILDVLECNSFPRNWSWTSDLVNPCTIILCYIDKISLNLKFRVKINEDFRITITNVKTGGSSEFDVNFAHISHFWEYLKELENCDLCEGTGFDDERSSPECTGVSLSHEMYKKLMNHFRCMACRKFRRKIQNRCNKKKVNIKDRYKILKREETTKNRQIKRLKRKVDVLKGIIKTENTNCA